MLAQVAHILVAALGALAGIVLAALAWLEANLAGAMTQAGIPRNLQSLLLIIVAVLFLIAAVRLFSGFIRIVAIVVLLAIAVHAVTYRGPAALPSVGHHG
ncbi:MAG TPA: hypothetical protein VMB71_01920 [Acetobacteraceae bacterium]|nr:hypothetical protein [Acetobacteraceae bacterium]